MESRANYCLMCDKRDESYCTVAKMDIKEFINLRLATCPLFKW